jgi:hypothetical protein
VSQLLARARARFEATPRSLEDDELTRIARGDRGCLGDLLSGLGAVTLVTAMILSALELIAFAWAYIGVAIWVGGFVYGTLSQSRSGQQRKGALESGPLVLASVLRADEWLRRPGKRVGRAVVLFTTDPARRFDREWLEPIAKQLERRLDGAAGTTEWVPVRALLADRDSFGVHPIPADLLERGDAQQLYLASMLVHPERLEGNYLGGEDDREANELGLELDATLRPATVVAIVDPERGFIEQVPRAPVTKAAKSDG